MADYDPNAGTDTSNGNGSTDWWNQNAPTQTSNANSFTNTSSVAASVPSGVPDPKHPGYDTNGYLLGSTNDKGVINIPNKSTGSTSQFNVADPLNTLSFTKTNTSGGGGDINGQSWGGPVAPYGGMQYPTFTPPPLPDYLQKPFSLPSASDLQATPGYMARYQQGLDANQRSAAAKGTLLNGGTQKALARYGQDYASNEYNNLVNQDLSQRQQQSSDYLNLAYGPAWQQNQSAVNQYGSLYGQYLDSVNNNRNSQNDYYSQQLGLLNAGLGAVKAGAPGSTGAQ